MAHIFTFLDSGFCTLCLGMTKHDYPAAAAPQECKIEQDCAGKPGRTKCDTTNFACTVRSPRSTSLDLHPTSLLSHS